MSTTAPTSRNAWLSGGAAASQMLMEGGTMAGNMLMPSPAKQRANQPSAHRNGESSSPRARPRQNRYASEASSTGTGLVRAMPGQPNQRAWKAGLSSGVHRLTTPISASVAGPSTRA